MAILVTGGAGFIGSHTVIELQNAGYDVVVVDNLYNASEKVIPGTSRRDHRQRRFLFIRRTFWIREALNEDLCKRKDRCMSFILQDLKAVGESVQKPWEYYENNIAGTSDIWLM